MKTIVKSISRHDDESRSPVLNKSASSLFHMLFKESSDGVIIMDLQGDIIDCNPAACKMTGRPGKSLKGSNFNDHFAIRGLNKAVAGINDVVENDGSNFIIGLDDDICELQACEIKAGRCGPDLIQIVCRKIDRLKAAGDGFDCAANLEAVNLELKKEIAERKRVEDELTHTFVMFEAMLAGIPGHIMVIDRDYRMLNLSPGLAEKYGVRDKETILGLRCYEFFQMADKPCSKCISARTMADGGLYSRFSTPDEERICGYPFKLFSVPVKCLRGEFIGVLECAIDVSDLRQAETAVKTALQEKEILLKEIHHRVKNNMQVVSSLLSLQAARESDARVLEALEESRSRVIAMALVHEALYGTATLAEIDLRSYIESLVGNISHAYLRGGLRVKLNIDVPAGILVGVDNAVPCGLVLNELISNALKHAFPDGDGELNIIARKPPSGLIHLTVEDNGVGLPDGFDCAGADTLGLSLVDRLVKEQLMGRIMIGRKGGTKFSILF